MRLKAKLKTRRGRNLVLHECADPVWGHPVTFAEIWLTDCPREHATWLWLCACPDCAVVPPQERLQSGSFASEREAQDDCSRWLAERYRNKSLH